MSDPRDRVLWFGAPASPTQLTEFINRGLAVTAADSANPLADVRGARAAVANIGSTGNAPLLGMVTLFAGRLLDHGLMIDIVTPDDATTGHVQKQIGVVATFLGVQLHTNPASAALAEAIARHDAGPAPQLDLEIFVPGNREDVLPGDRILFQRAFPQCSSITLVELGGGRSDARVFAVHMTVARSKIGAWPQPAFAKIDRREKIAVEYANYRECAERFIPFGLRPNIETMVVGHARSLLVGNFVDRSESLWDLARRHVAGPAITALLEETLGGWRDQGYAQDPLTGSVAAEMRKAGLWDPDRINGDYVARADRDGVAHTPGTLWAGLAALEQCYRIAPIHGDLNGENVRVRGNSAILIDLASVSKGPLTADLAALETWLAFELPPETNPEAFFDPEWTAVIERLYNPQAFRHPPGPSRPATRFAWMEEVVRQIRRMGIAVQSCASEYQTAVAVQLLRRCQWADGCPGDRGRRAAGYRIAARLVDNLMGDDI